MNKLISRRGFLSGTAGAAALTLASGLPLRPARAADHVVMQLGWIANVEYMGMFVADDAGYYKDEGLELEIVPGGPAISVAPIVASGKALVGLEFDRYDCPRPRRGRQAQGHRRRAATQPDCRHVARRQADQDAAGPRRQEVRRPAERLSDHSGLPEDEQGRSGEVTIVPVQFDPAPLVNGEVDAFMSFLTNQPIQLELKGIENTNFLLSDFGYVEWADCLVVSEDSLADPAKRKQLVGIVRATVRGWQDAVADPKRGATLAVTKYGKSFNLDQHTQELIAAKIAPLVATPETEKNGLFTMSKAGIDANIAAIQAVGVQVSRRGPVRYVHPEGGLRRQDQALSLRRP